MKKYKPNHIGLRLFVWLLCFINIGILALLMLDASPLSLNRSTAVSQRVTGSAQSSVIGATTSLASESTVNAMMISLDDKKLPALTQDTIWNILDIYIDAGVLTATDPSGEDITSHIRCTMSADEENVGTFHIAFLVETAEGYSDKKSIDVSVPVKAPLLVLTSDRATLHVGDTFNYWNYLVCALDIDGSPLNQLIAVYGREFDTSVPGEYTVTYRVHSQKDDSISQAVLTVTVE